MSGTIKHYWTGTVLTIESDSGISSADLKGEKGDTGIRGAQGAQGEGKVLSVNGRIGDVVITADEIGSVNQSYVDTAINSIVVPTKVSAFENDAGYLTEHQSLTNYYTKTEVDALTSDFITSIPAEYITESELDAKGYITEQQDLSAYALKSEIPSLDGYAKTADLSVYALKSEIPDVSAYQTEAQVIALIQSNMPASGDEVSY